MNDIYICINHRNPQWQNTAPVKLKYHPKTSCYMDWFFKAVEIKLHPDDINRDKGFKLSKAWNPSTRLLRHSTPYIHHENPRKTERCMLKRKQNKWQQGHQVKQHGNRLQSEGWPHSLTPPSYCIVHYQEEAPIWQTGIKITDIWSFTTLTLKIETEEISEMLVFISNLTWLIVWEDFSIKPTKEV
jgi:hypothetical protein